MPRPCAAVAIVVAKTHVAAVLIGGAVVLHVAPAKTGVRLEHQCDHTSHRGASSRRAAEEIGVVVGTGAARTEIVAIGAGQIGRDDNAIRSRKARPVGAVTRTQAP